MSAEHNREKFEDLSKLIENLEGPRAASILLGIPFQMLQRGLLESPKFEVIYVTVSYMFSQGGKMPALCDQDLEISEQIRKRVREEGLNRTEESQLFLSLMNELKPKEDSFKSAYFCDCLAGIARNLS